MGETFRRARRGMACMAVAAVLATGCGGGDGDDSSAGREVPQGDEAVAPVDGCGDGALIDPTDLSKDRDVARCEPGRPAAQPLPDTESVTLALGYNAEFAAPILLAEELGEFEAENLDVEIVPIGFVDAIPQMLTGQIDASNGAPDAGWYNAAGQGIDVRWVLGNFFVPDGGRPEVPQTGLWVRRDVFSDPDDPDLAELEGTTVATAAGLGSVISYPIGEALEEVGLGLDDLTIQQIPSADMLQALDSGAVDAAWLLDPYWIDASENDEYVQVVTQPPAETLGGLYFSSRLLDDDRPVGLAVLRALVRTVNTHLAGDYQSDAEVLQALSEVTSTPVEAIEATPSLVFDWEIRDGTTGRTQKHFLATGAQTTDGEIPEDQLVDRSLYEEVVGR